MIEVGKNPTLSRFPLKLDFLLLRQRKDNSLESYPKCNKFAAAYKFFRGRERTFKNICKQGSLH